jgi:hypothetical protein
MVSDFQFVLRVILFTMYVVHCAPAHPASCAAGQKWSLSASNSQLGYSTLSTTADIYTSVDEQQVTETAEALGKAFCGRRVVEIPSISNSVN